MIARIGYFGHLTPEQEAASLDNLRRRFKAAISSQDGYVAGYWLRRPDGRLISLSIWQSEDHLRNGGTRAGRAAPAWSSCRVDSTCRPGGDLSGGRSGVIRPCTSGRGAAHASVPATESGGRAPESKRRTAENKR
jgi:hypothetical protein